MEYFEGRNESDNLPEGAAGQPGTKQKTAFQSFRLYRNAPPSQPVEIIKPKQTFFSGSVSTGDRILFLDNMSTMLKAGLSLAPALNTLKKESKNKFFINVITFLEKYVENGQLLSKGMEQYPKIFPEMISSTIAVGENSGRLADAASHLSEILKAQKKLRSKVISALMYPTIVLIALVGVSLFLALMVFPQLISLFVEADVELPFVLVAVQGLNFVILNYTWYIIGGLILLIVLWKVIFRLSGPKYFIHVIMLRLPLVGKITSELSLTRFASNLTALLAAGLSIVESLEIVSKTVNNQPYRRAILAMSKELQKGVSLEHAMRARPKLFPSLAVQLCQVGETTGELENVLKKLAEFYEERVNNILNNLSTILEPILLVIVGVAVAFIALSVINPLYELTNSFGEA